MGCFESKYDSDNHIIYDVRTQHDAIGQHTYLSEQQQQQHSASSALSTLNLNDPRSPTPVFREELTASQVKDLPRQTFVAICDYNDAYNTNISLSMQSGDPIRLIGSPDSEGSNNEHCSDWLYAQNDRTGNLGYVPAEFVASADSDYTNIWYHGPINKRDAKDLLEREKPGTFLVRDSETWSINKPLTISFKVSSQSGGNEVFHVRITTGHGDGNYSLAKDGKQFISLKELIHFYQIRPIPGMNMKLGNHCPRTHLQAKTFFRENWKLPMDSLTFDSLLGEGHFAQVWSGTIEGKRKVAIKILKGKANPSDLIEEAKVMKELKHHNLVALYGVCFSGEPYCIVTELMQKGNLLDYVRSEAMNADLLVVCAELLDISREIVQGMKYLESKSYVHRDLAARNVLIGSNCEIKIADFGLAGMVTSDGSDENTAFPVRWTAPEAAVHKKFSTRSDVWSFGVVLYEMFSFGTVPYLKIPHNYLMTMIQGGYRLKRPDNCPKQVYAVMLSCWHLHPEERPSFKKLLFSLNSILDTPVKQLICDE